MVDSGTFWKTVVCGFIATFVMAMIAFLQGGIGLPVIDVGHILKQSFNHVHTTDPYSILWGNVAYFIVGILLAVVWVALLQQIIPGNWLIQGLIYGTLISLVAALIVAPLAASAAGDSIGMFYSDTWYPGLILLAALTMHLGYGLVLTLSLKIAGLDKSCRRMNID
jgi:uncharacterized membrane protein YagU involved in acid resistance